MPEEPKSRYVKMSISLRADIARKIEAVMAANGVDRSSAVAMMLQRVNMEDVLPSGYKWTEEEGRDGQD